MSTNPFLIRRTLLSLSVATALSSMVMGAMAPAAMAAEAEALEEVVVTGSRIVRRDFESNSPIITVDAADFEQQAGMNVESFLNQLPTYNPAASPVTTQGDVQITPVNTVVSPLSQCAASAPTAAWYLSTANAPLQSIP